MSQIKLTHSGIEASFENGLLFVTINRPSNANAYTQQMLADLGSCIELANNDDQIKVIVITGSGDKVFCAGADRNEIDTREWRSILRLKSAAIFKALRDCSKVSIAAINGAAVGGGFELAISCDIRIASTNAKFWLPELEFGLLPAAAATNLLPQYIGIPRAKDLILGGARWGVEEAYAAGLLSEVCQEGELINCVKQWVDRIKKRDADSISVGKQLLELNSGGQDSLRADLLAQALLAINKRSGE
jgi:enoyl-CoA hydratase